MRVAPLSLLLASLLACTDRASGSDGETTTGSTTDPTTSTTSPPATETGMPTTDKPIPPTTAGPVCEPYTFSPLVVVQAPRVMLVVDHSAAMADVWDHDGDPQTPDRARWASVRATLEAVLTTSGPLQAALGLARFPGAKATGEYAAEACAADPGELLPPATDNVDAVLAALPPADATPVGAAPLRGVLLAAIDALAQDADESVQALVILTHSAPNCGESAPDLATLLEGLDEAVALLLAEAQAQGVRVLVIGVGTASGPGSDAVDMRPDGVDLAGYWQAVGTETSVVADEAALLHQLTALFDAPGPGSCVFSISPAPEPWHRVGEVRVAGTSVPQVDDCEVEDGWGSLAEGEIRLCGAACELYQETRQLEVELVCDE